MGAVFRSPDPRVIAPATEPSNILTVTEMLDGGSGMALNGSGFTPDPFVGGNDDR